MHSYVLISYLKNVQYHGDTVAAVIGVYEKIGVLCPGSYSYMYSYVTTGTLHLL